MIVLICMDQVVLIATELRVKGVLLASTFRRANVCVVLLGALRAAVTRSASHVMRVIICQKARVLDAVPVFHIATLAIPVRARSVRQDITLRTASAFHAVIHMIIVNSVIQPSVMHVMKAIGYLMILARVMSAEKDMIIARPAMLIAACHVATVTT